MDQRDQRPDPEDQADQPWAKAAVYLTLAVLVVVLLVASATGTVEVFGY